MLLRSWACPDILLALCFKAQGGGVDVGGGMPVSSLLIRSLCCDEVLKHANSGPKGIRRAASDCRQMGRLQTERLSREKVCLPGEGRLGSLREQGSRGQCTAGREGGPQEDSLWLL